MLLYYLYYGISNLCWQTCCRKLEVEGKKENDNMYNVLALYPDFVSVVEQLFNISSQGIMYLESG